MKIFLTKQHQRLALAMLLALTGVTTASIAGEMVDRTASASGVSYVNIASQSGEVNIIGWDKDEISVEGELADKAKKLIFEKNGGQFNIKVVWPRSSSWRSTGSQLTIYMPKSIKMNYSGVSADVKVKNLTRSVEVKTVSGDVIATNLSDHVELSSVSGTITSNGLSGKISLSVVSGDIDDKNSVGRLKLQAVSGEIISKSSANEVSVNNVSGDINVALKNVDEYRVSAVSGDIESSLSLNDDGVVKASTVSGSIDLAFQDNIQADFRLKTSAGGRIINNVTSDKAKHAKYGPSAKLYFQKGNANGSVRVGTVSGRVKVGIK